MNAHSPKNPSSERVVRVPSGWVMLIVTFALLAGGLSMFRNAVNSGEPLKWIFLAIGLHLLFVISCFGFFTLQPNEARVLLLFGSYQGSARESGFHWTNPFNRK